MKTAPPVTAAEKVALLKKRIEESGLPTMTFARSVLLRDDRTVRRWITGESPIPNLVMDFLIDPWVIPWPRARGGNR